MLEPQIFELDLPEPSAELIKAVRDFSLAESIDTSATEWLNSCNDNTINSVEFFFKQADSIDQMLRQEYANYFSDTDIFTLIGFMRNPGTTPACLPPHCDQARALAINYYIDLGGSDVVTTFYDFNMPPLLDSGRNYRYDEVNKVGYYKFKTNQWYAFDASQCHSVENIESNRLMLIIFRTNNPDSYTITDFINQNTRIKSHQVFIEKQ